MASVTIGQYYHENSIIHKLDPRVKLFGTMAYIISLFLVNSIWGYVISALGLAIVIKMAKIPFKKLLNGLKGILFILLFSAVLNMFFVNEGTVLLEIWKLKLTTGGLYRALFVATRLVFLVLGTSVMTLTTKPADLSDGIEKAFGFLQKFRFPIHEMAMIMSLALRFIPTLMDETDKIMKAQKARGADFESGNLFERVKSYLPLLIPLFVSSINRALDLATAMEARCYNGGVRTKLRPLKYDTTDFISYWVCVAFVAVIVITDVIVLQLDGLSFAMF